MKFAIYGENKGVWMLKPLSGKHEGKVIALVEGADLTDVEFHGQTAEGTLKAVWGLTILNDAYYDPETIRALCINKAFKGVVERPIVLHDDGFFAGVGRLRGAKRFRVFRDAMFRG